MSFMSRFRCKSGSSPAGAAAMSPSSSESAFLEPPLPAGAADAGAASAADFFDPVLADAASAAATDRPRRVGEAAAARGWSAAVSWSASASPKIGRLRWPFSPLLIASCQKFVLQNANHTQAFQFFSCGQLNSGERRHFPVSRLVKIGERLICANVCELQGSGIGFFDKIILCVCRLFLVPRLQKEWRDHVGIFAVNTLNSKCCLDLFETMWPRLQKLMHFAGVS